MSRNDTHLDGILRLLGAAYYDSLLGRASQADVTRAVDNVAAHLNEQVVTAGPDTAADAAKHAGHSRRAGRDLGFHGWSRRVGDVMSTTVVTEADLLTAEAATARRLQLAHRHSLLPLPHAKEHPAPTAAELMTSPAITVGAHVTVHAAGRLMSSRHIRLLPVVDEHARLIGVVSRRDLLSVFLRPDADIAADVRMVLDEILLVEPGEADVAVRDGIVTLTGALDPATGEHGDLIPVAIRLMWDVDGVVDIVDKLGASLPAARAEAALPERAR